MEKDSSNSQILVQVPLPSLGHIALPTILTYCRRIDLKWHPHGRNTDGFLHLCPSEGPCWDPWGLCNQQFTLRSSQHQREQRRDLLLNPLYHHLSQGKRPLRSKRQGSIRKWHLLLIFLSHLLMELSYLHHLLWQMSSGIFMNWWSGLLTRCRFP